MVQRSHSCVAIEAAVPLPSQVCLPAGRTSEFGMVRMCGISKRANMLARKAGRLRQLPRQTNLLEWRLCRLTEKLLSVCVACVCPPWSSNGFASWSVLSRSTAVRNPWVRQPLCAFYTRPLEVKPQGEIGGLAGVRGWRAGWRARLVCWLARLVG